MAVPNTFANATTSIPLSQLDQNFATAITLGNTAIQLGNTVTTLNNMTLANVTVSSGNVTVTSLSGAFNGTVGATTQNTGAFTTLSATSTANTKVFTVAASSSGDQFYVKPQAAGSGIEALSRNAADSAYAPWTMLASVATMRGETSSKLNVNGTDIATASSTGLAVTGTLSATGIVTAGGTDGFKTSADNLGIYFNGSRNAVIGSNASDTVTIAAANAARGVFSSTGLAVTGALSCTGALSKGSGSFRIKHPLPQLSETHQLVHSFIEGPKADLIYRGTVTLVNGAATVNIDSAAGMTEGTFVVLCRDVQCFTTNESDWTPVRGSVAGNVLTIEAQDNTSTASVSWMVIGERQDQHMYDTDWTDDDGHVIVEPLKPVVENQEQADAQV